MARYFFDLINGKLSSCDKEGGEFKSLGSVETEVVRALTDMVRDVRLIDDFTNIGIAVRNETGETILKIVLHLDIVRTPAL